MDKTGWRHAYDGARAEIDALRDERVTLVDDRRLLGSTLAKYRADKVALRRVVERYRRALRSCAHALRVAVRRQRGLERAIIRECERIDNACRELGGVEGSTLEERIALSADQTRHLRDRMYAAEDARDERDAEVALLRDIATAVNAAVSSGWRLAEREAVRDAWRRWRDARGEAGT